MDRYEFSGDRSSKFWEVSVAGTTLVVRFGRVGTAGQNKENSFDTGRCVMQPILDAWSVREPHGYPNYEAGSQGPRNADELLARHGRVWRKI